jgi:EAL domain-containing protein (putative c-di-GMP-specific phosphodiesterase class I)
VDLSDSRRWDAVADSGPSDGGFPPYTYAYQPIVDTRLQSVFSHEALIRGPNRESAFHLLEQVPADARFRFDQESRCRAIEMAAERGYEGRLNLNFLPQDLAASSIAIFSTLEAARKYRIAIDRIVLEITEEEVIHEPGEFAALLNEYRGTGLLVAIDDFGAGYSGLNLLADFQPDLIKIDMKLVRGIECNGPRQAIVRALAQACADLGIDIIAEGVETLDEYAWFSEQGIHLFQGYLFARPGFEDFPPVEFPALSGRCGSAGTT